MIKPNEIKIDNIVYIPETKQIVKITAINKHLVVGVNNGFICIPFDKIEPIKITHELLESSSEFILCEGIYGEYFKHKELEGFRVWLVENEHITAWQIGCKDYESNQFYIISHDIKYIHRLQNVFSDLTGCKYELNFKI